LLGLVLAIPTLLLSLPAGHLADTYSRRGLFSFMQLSTTLCAAGLMLVSSHYAQAGWSLAAMYALLFFGAIGGTIGRPGREALMAGLVPTETYPNAVTWNATSFELSSMTGPALGGLIVGWFNPAAAYATAAVAFIISFGLIFLLPDSRAERKKESAGFKDLAVGVKFVFRTKLLLATLTLDLFAVLFGGAVYLLPMIADEVLHVGPRGFGCLRAAPSIGAVAMAMIQAHLPPFKRAGRALLLSVAGFGAATIVFGLSHSYVLSFLMLVITGATDNISVVVRHSLVPLLTPDRMRGRVMAVNQVFVGSSNELGGLESGMTAAWWGAVPSVVFGGVMSVLVVIAVAMRFPQVRRLASLHDVEPAEDEARAVEAA
ncbi:MAG: MFS transporter, partial [Tepidisphaeraceae bacterium]